MIDKNSVQFLKKLIDLSSPSGSEQDAVALWKKELEPFVDEVRTDINGNCIASLIGDSPKIMLAAHIDEIGFMVKYIDESGYIYFSSIGGIDTGIISGQRVRIMTKKGQVLGVIGRKPIHLLDADEKKKTLKMEDFWIDIGAENEKDTKSKIDIGDIVVFDVGLDVLNLDRLVARGFDDKSGVFVISQVLKALSKKKFPASVYGVATVQEEIGLRGARTSAYGISPDIAIAIDVTFASDFPTMNKKQSGDIRIGHGPVIAKGPNIHPKIFDLLVETAKKENIPYQIDGVSKATGTDANAIQITKAGIATGLLSIPLRYMHTPVEIISSKDLENTAKLLEYFICRVDKTF